MAEAVVYKIENIINSKKYIGSTKNKEKRWKEHKRGLHNNYHYNHHLQRSWNKYGKDKFKFKVLEQVPDKDNLLEREQYYLDSCNPQYNIAIKADSSELSEKTKEKMSQAKSGENHPLYNKHHTEEAKQKMSEAAQGRTYTEETIKKKRGEKHWNSKLTSKKVKVIKYLLKGGKFSYKKIGKMYSVTAATISYIKNGKRWTHVKI